ncbi:MAG: dihydropteroate synthase [Desulfobulbaceae bacterium]|nr:dihydropteroate synthase [Pseudomonadota bacterium]MCG2748578.1 dihydropteroate synthase [Desulfobulbaceae bacterium]
MKILTRDRALNFHDKVHVMGIVNITPDSFSDGGKISDENSLLALVDHLVDSGADIIDIGGESTRPFAPPVTLQEELDRVIPAIWAIRRRHHIPISIDTTKAEVARCAIEAGADIINDISALSHDPAMVSVAAEHQVPVIIMHMQGTPRNMQIMPHYDDVVGEIRSALGERIQWAENNGVSRDRIIIDPGIGFGKTVNHNLTILRELRQFTTLGCPVLIGHSRKSFIGKILGIDDASGRDEATALISALCAWNGASIIRVHDVARTVQAVKMTHAISKGCAMGND